MRKMLLSGKCCVQGLVQRARRGEIVPEGLLDHHARVLRVAGGARCSMTTGNMLGGIAR